MEKKLFVGLILILVLILVSGCVEDQSEIQNDADSRVNLAAPSGLERSGISIFSDEGLGHGIVVSGEGSSTVIPDIGILTIGAVTTALTSEEALRENSDIMDSVMETLKKSGIQEKDIKTQTVNIWPQFDHGGDEKEDLSRIIGYRVENRISVTVRDITNIGSVIDRVTDAGANQIYGLSFTVSDDRSKTLQSQLLKDAVDDASEKARIIADALGAEEITPVRVVEGIGYSTPFLRYDVANLEKSGVATPVSPGETEIRASVTVTYDF